MQDPAERAADKRQVGQIRRADEAVCGPIEIERHEPAVGTQDAGDFIDGGLVYEACPYCGRSLPRLLGNISRKSEVRQMHLDKIKGTLIDFNELEHVLDDAPQIGAWQIELRKVNDDPLELDEVILHVEKLNGADEDRLTTDLNERCSARVEIHPNRVVFHSAEESRKMQGVGVALKEQKLVDHQPKTDLAGSPNGSNGSGTAHGIEKDTLVGKKTS